MRRATKNIMEQALFSLFVGLALIGLARAQTIGPILDGPFSLPILAKTTTYSGTFNGSGPALVRVQLSAPNILTTGNLVLNGATIMRAADFAGGLTQVDKSVTLIGQNSFSFTVGGTRGATVTLTVYRLIMPTPSGLAPNPLALTLGTNGTLTAALSPTPTASGTLSVSSSNVAVATVPSSIAFAANQASVSIPVTTVGSGSATITASANGGSASAAVNVNAPPSVSITSPASGAIFAAPASITIAASAADADGTIAKVEFFEGATLLGTATAAPYSVSLANVAAGNHGYTARATDNNGIATTSAAVSVVVNALPSVSITSPTAGASFNSPASITIAANAADSDGTIAKVDFYQGTTLLGTATAAPYSFAWTNVGSGSYSLTAVATDNQGGTATSAAVPITVNTPPTVGITSPSDGAVFPAPAIITVTANASDPDGSIAKVDFYQGATLMGTATAAPFSATSASLGSGTYSFTAVATDNSGATTTSAAVSVRANAAPTVTITAPTTGATFNAPASITISATALDPDGTIVSVAFYQNGTLITTVTPAPYNFTWTGVPQGSYSLTGVATDDGGATATSDAVVVTVGAHVARMYFVHPDHLNTPMAVSDGSETVVWKWDQTEPFGDSVADGDPNNTGSVFDFPLSLSLYYLDKETGQRYAQMRDGYDAALGRFPQSDPIGLYGGSLSPYAYTGNRPLIYTDRSGLTSYQCRKPLDALTTLLGASASSFAKNYIPSAYHQYSCVVDKNGMVTCGGQDHSGSPVRSAGKPSEDTKDAGQCKMTQPDNECFEECLKAEWQNPRPTYGIPFGTDCQEYDDEVNQRCRKKCNLK